MTNNLVAWRRSIEQKFVPSNNVTPTPQDVSSVNAKIASMRAKLEQQLRDGATHLQTVRNEILARQNTSKGALEAAHHNLAQAQADFAVMQRSP
ncbi:molecular chaperone [Paraburkholderia diazotrophica]|uniref:molecular chaperone n=1 Tax=Paraburkholderia diazotrophica TaxID=667676 RepID=UPI000A660F1E|nr:molecular chaperone [Paraburkholderia diazotrophica]